MDSETGAPGRILLVDDDKSILRTFGHGLEDAGYAVTMAHNAAQARAQADIAAFDMCFLDMRMDADSGLDLLSQLREIAPWMRVVMAIAQSDVDTAVKAVHAGAVDYLVKPCSLDQLRLCADKQVQTRQMQLRLQQLQADIGAVKNNELASINPAMSAVVERARQVAASGAHILILGESGTGKGMLAHAIHHWSKRANSGFVTINCPALSAQLLESELFGHRKGSFTGATENTDGRVNQANGGTLFLDEIRDFPQTLQPKLLRFIRDREYERIGDPVTRTADARIVAATNQKLEEMVKEKTFGEDLYDHLNIIRLLLPPLRERPQDVPALASGFLARYAKAYHRPACEFSDSALRQLQTYAWPGNVRELRNVIERASIFCDEAEVQDYHLGIGGATGERAARPRAGDHMSIADLERAHITAAIANIKSLDETARLLGIDVSTLYRKRKQYGI